MTARSIPKLLVALVWAELFHLAATLTIEHSDSFEYLLAGRSLWTGEHYSVVKNPLLSTVLGLLYGIARPWGLDKSLALYHVAIVALELAALVLLSLALSRRLPVSSWTFFSLFTFSRVVTFYGVTVLPDVLSMILIGLWWWVDLSQPRQTWVGRLSRGAVLGLCALSRLQTILIPLACLFHQACQTRQWRLPVYMALLGGVIYGYGSTIFVSRVLFAEKGLAFLAPRFLWEGLCFNIRFLLEYSPSVSTAHLYRWDQLLETFFVILNPFGTALLVSGVVAWRRMSETDKSVLRPTGPLLLGSGVFLAFLISLWILPREDRYISPVLPALVFLQGLGMEMLGRKNSWLYPLFGIGMFLFTVVPLHRAFSPPGYRVDLERKTAISIARWAGAQPIYLDGEGLGPLYSVSREPHAYDSDNYRYWGFQAAFQFYTDIKLKFMTRRLTFRESGRPIPDDLRHLIPEGAALIIPPAHVDKMFTPIQVVRWTEGRDAPDTGVAGTRDFRVDVFSPDVNDGSGSPR